MSVGMARTCCTCARAVQVEKGTTVKPKKTSTASRRQGLAWTALAATVALPTRAWALSTEEAIKKKEERKAALRAAAAAAKEQEMEAENAAERGEFRKTVQDIGDVFGESEYSIGEDHSPNSHSHQEEGAKSAKSFY